MGAAYTQTGVLAKGRAKGSAGEIEELGRELGLAGASPPPKQGGDLSCDENATEDVKYRQFPITPVPYPCGTSPREYGPSTIKGLRP